MKALVVGSAVAAVFVAVSSAHAQNNNSNLPFLRPQNGAQVQVPSGWPPGSGDFQARPPTSYVAPGGYAPFQGNSVGRGNSVEDRGMDRGVVGEPETESSQPRTDTADSLIGTPGRVIMRKQGQGNDKPGSVQQEEPVAVRAISREMYRRRRKPFRGSSACPRTSAKGKVSSLISSARRARSSRRHRPDMPAAVGSRLPAAWVYRDVPETVTRALPSYVGYVYTNVDGRYVVCDPATYKVVAVYAESAS